MAQGLTKGTDTSLRRTAWAKQSTSSTCPLPNLTGPGINTLQVCPYQVQPNQVFICNFSLLWLSWINGRVPAKSCHWRRYAFGMALGAVTCGNSRSGVRVEAVDLAGFDDAALNVRLRWLGCGQWRREPLRR